jgi:hypothetical protein
LSQAALPTLWLNKIGCGLYVLAVCRIRVAVEGKEEC